MLTAILLASGFSHRHPANKLTMDFHGKPVIEYTMEAISRCPFTEMLLIRRDDAYSTLAEKYGFRAVNNDHAMEGQSSSIQLGIAHTASHSALMFFVGDQPYLSKTIIDTLIEAHMKYPDQIIQPYADCRPRNPVIFPAVYRSELNALRGDTGGRQIIRKHPEQVHTVTFQEALSFADIDTPEDYYRLRSL